MMDAPFIDFDKYDAKGYQDTEIILDCLGYVVEDDIEDTEYLYMAMANVATKAIKEGAFTEIRDALDLFEPTSERVANLKKKLVQEMKW